MKYLKILININNNINIEIHDILNIKLKSNFMHNIFLWTTKIKNLFDNLY